MKKIFNYQNGLRAVHCHMESVRSVSIGIFVKTGSVNEDIKSNGISHLIEHMLFKGTKKRTAFQVADDIDVLGAQINAFTSKSTTCYYTISTFDHAEACMEVLSDIFFDSVLDEAELVKEKKVVLEEIDMVDDTPDENVMEMVVRAYYGDHPLGRPILGSKKSVKSFKSQDLRAYQKKHYAADNVVISIAGHISAQGADDLIRKYFLDKFEETSSPKAQLDRHINTAPVSVKKTKQIEQANLSFALPCYEFNHKNESALYAFNNIFGGGMSSKLFQRIREQMGLAYSVYSYASTYQNDGLFLIYLATNPEQSPLAYEAVLDTAQEFLKTGITDREFLSGKEQIKGGLILGQESSSAIMRINGKYLLGAGKLFDFDEFLASIARMTKDDIMNAAEYTLDFSKMATAYLGKGRGA